MWMYTLLITIFEERVQTKQTRRVEAGQCDGRPQRQGEESKERTAHKSVSRSGAAQSGGSEQKSATPTPRDAVRAVLDGDRKGSGVWKIVAGVRNRLRAGPGR